MDLNYVKTAGDYVVDTTKNSYVIYYTELFKRHFSG